jgi:hypothetical protein
MREGNTLQERCAEQNDAVTDRKAIKKIIIKDFKAAAAAGKWDDASEAFREKDMCRLLRAENNHLNNQIVNQWTRLWAKLVGASWGGEEKAGAKMMIQDSFHINSLRLEDGTLTQYRVQRSAKHVKFRNYDLIFIPMFDKPGSANGIGHWCLAEVDPRKRRIIMWDSLGSRSKSDKDEMKNWCEWIFNPNGKDPLIWNPEGSDGGIPNPTAWTITCEEPGSQGRNVTDCGLFLLNTVSCRARENPIKPNLNLESCTRTRFLIGNDIAKRTIGIPELESGSTPVKVTPKQQDKCATNCRIDSDMSVVKETVSVIFNHKPGPKTTACDECYLKKRKCIRQDSNPVCQNCIAAGKEHSCACTREDLPKTSTSTSVLCTDRAEELRSTLIEDIKQVCLRLKQSQAAAQPAVTTKQNAVPPPVQKKKATVAPREGVPSGMTRKEAVLANQPVTVQELLKCLGNNLKTAKPTPAESYELWSVGKGTLGEVIMADFTPEGTNNNHKIAFKVVKDKAASLNLMREWFFLHRLQNCPGMIQLVPNEGLIQSTDLTRNTASAQEYLTQLKGLCFAPVTNTIQPQRGRSQLQQFVPAISMEYLSSKVWDNKKGFWGEQGRRIEALITFCHSLLRSVASFEQHGVLHNDIKDTNMKWTNTWPSELKIFDLGGAGFEASQASFRNPLPSQQPESVSGTLSGTVITSNAREFNSAVRDMVIAQAAQALDTFKSKTLGVGVQKTVRRLVSDLFPMSHNSKVLLAQNYAKGADDFQLTDDNGEGITAGSMHRSVGETGTPGWRYKNYDHIMPQTMSESHIQGPAAGSPHSHKRPHSNDSFAVGLLVMNALTAGIWLQVKDVAMTEFYDQVNGRWGDVGEAVWNKWVQDNCSRVGKQAPRLWGGSEAQSRLPEGGALALANNSGLKRKRLPGLGKPRKRKEHLNFKLATALAECAEALLCQGKSCRSELTVLTNTFRDLQSEFTVFSDFLESMKIGPL